MDNISDLCTSFAGDIFAQSCSGYSQRGLVTGKRDGKGQVDRESEARPFAAESLR